MHPDMVHVRTIPVSNPLALTQHPSVRRFNVSQSYTVSRRCARLGMY